MRQPRRTVPRVRRLFAPTCIAALHAKNLAATRTPDRIQARVANRTAMRTRSRIPVRRPARRTTRAAILTKVRTPVRTPNRANMRVTVHTQLRGPLRLVRALALEKIHAAVRVMVLAAIAADAAIRVMHPRFAQELATTTRAAAIPTRVQVSCGCPEKFSRHKPTNSRRANEQNLRRTFRSREVFNLHRAFFLLNCDPLQHFFCCCDYFLSKVLRTRFGSSEIAWKL